MTPAEAAGTPLVATPTGKGRGAGPTEQAPRVREPLRTDIQALRAFAVLAVVLYHLWPNRLTGGYIGVDIFFVISGYLIGAHLLREVRERGTIALGTFWARRAKRLLPASLLVLAATAVATVVWVPRSLWSQFLSEVAASALYVENWFLAHDAIDYLASSNSASPVRHFWTLSAEEQFYVGLPLLLVGTAWLARRARRGQVPWLRAAIATAVLGSFAYSVWLMTTTPSVAYFSTLSRAWEFGAGALLATVTIHRIPFRALAAWIGIALIATACVTFDAGTPFPGTTALLPVVGTVIAIAAGQGTWLARWGAWRPVAFLGETSYGAYLWHWPLVILLPFATGHRLGTLDKLAILAATLVLAAMSTHLVENPVRFRLLGRARPRVVGLWTVAAMATVLALAVVPLHQNDEEIARRAAEVAAASDPGKNPCLGAEALLSSPCSDAPVPAFLVPDPANLAADDSNRPECFTSRADATFRVCALGPASYSRHLLALGDSHNNTLIAAYDRIARERGWRIDVAGRGGCYWTTAEQVVDNPSTSDACRAWRASAADHIAAATDLDAIIVTNSRLGPPVEAVPGRSLEQATADGMIQAWDARPDPQRTPVIAIGDNPAVTARAIACVEKNGPAAATRCVIPLDEATRDVDAQQSAASSAVNAHFIDTTRLYCTTDGCPAVIGGVIVYRDVTSHLTATYVRTIAGFLGDSIDALLPTRP